MYVIEIFLHLGAIYSRSIPVPGKPILVEGPSHLPEETIQGSGFIRCRCRPAGNLAQDIAIHNLAPSRLLTRATTLIPVPGRTDHNGGERPKIDVVHSVPNQSSILEFPQVKHGASTGTSFPANPHLFKH